MTALLDCVGILKICTYDVKQRRLTKSASNCSVCLVFRAFIPDPSGGPDTVIQTESEPIRCVQQLGVPEVFKMSLNTANARGGCDLFVIGRNFDHNTTVLFREYKEDGNLSWSAEAPIDKQYLHQCHIVCTVPTYHSLGRGGTVSVTVKCGSKLSHPTTFHFTPNPEDDDWRPPESPKYEIPSYDRGYEASYTPLGYGSLSHGPGSSGAYHHDDDKGAAFGKRMKLTEDAGPHNSVKPAAHEIRHAEERFRIIGAMLKTKKNKANSMSWSLRSDAARAAREFGNDVRLSRGTIENHLVRLANAKAEFVAYRQMAEWAIDVDHGLDGSSSLVLKRIIASTESERLNVARGKGNLYENDISFRRTFDIRQGRHPVTGCPPGRPLHRFYFRTSPSSSQREDQSAEDRRARAHSP
ncbi:hypothetical protein QR680_019273 [Steinernema hermaphroditum]|uniref:RHD domain-containing protein n=1 Tax=Steinernema hermaphroditum TaxID=289476 RepID=A0AA39HKI3_9BILA|nr:hypothetical protein QR680_019273 [Steinernema hermaphroditum]